ncbi:hypothetical protein [Demequina muriae]|uniref:Uncharacterized protein n=1 Tax=Demequina muriae TaxID=3051664 RepID=A0ABT8GG85_9MICO|nr:hypothetical protein [Demequina sp. EGI L300058]MDN4480430.1 hypothetical protein [Demequina sp. EGI L300058]
MKSTPVLTEAPAPITVSVAQKLMSPSVGYVDQIVGEDSEGLTFRSFAGVRRGANADVIHLHRLHALGGSRTMSGKDRIAVALAFAAMVKRNRIALVRTWHGADASGGGGRAAGLANWILNRVTTTFVIVDPSTPEPRRGSTALIPYGHYRERFVGYPRVESTVGRVLCIAPHLHKNVDQVVEAFVGGDAPHISLRVVGSAPPERADGIERLAQAKPDAVSTRIERISDGTMVEEITGSELVVLPNTSEIEDLHMMFMALSLDRPILVPDNALTRSLATSVGAGWVHRYRAPLTASSVSTAVESLRSAPPAERPRLEGRDPGTTAAMYAEVFMAAAKKRRPR